MKALLTVLSAQDFKVWQAQQSAIAQRGFDADDKVAHWGWDWKEAY
jgi:hypothetical protein